jgi:glycosyltransferase involved in cell wall biosynthesis
LAQGYLKVQRFEAAIEYARVATGLNPAAFTAWLVLGLALRESSQPVLAREALARAREIAPNNPLVIVESGCNEIDLGSYRQGIESITRAREFAPEWQLLRWIDALALPILPASDEEAVFGHERFAAGVESLIADLQHDTNDARTTAAQGLPRATPFYLHYFPMDTTQTSFRYAELIESAVRFVVDDALLQPLDWKALSHGGKIRIGFVSCELRNHTVTRYFSEWIVGLDAQRFDVQCWHLGLVADSVTEDFRAQVSAFHHLPEASVSALAQSIRDAQLDVLVYLDVGMDSRPQMLAALRLAPVQCAAYGHPVTTGLRNVDWFLSGDAMEPTNAQSHYRERLHRLPALGVVPKRPPPPGDGTWLPREVDRPLVLCLQSLFKLTPEFDVAIARIAAATDAKILFFEFPAEFSERLRDRLRVTFDRHGLDLNRHVDVLARRTYPEYLGGIAAADLVLDSTGFSGGATSLDALSVGTPVVTLEGEFMRGRQTAGMLRLLNVDELITSSFDEYVELSARLCSDKERRDELRQRLRARAGILFDANEVIPALESFFERVTNEVAVQGGSA